MASHHKVTGSTAAGRDGMHAMPSPATATHAAGRGHSVDSALVHGPPTGQRKEFIAVHKEKGLGLCIPFQALLEAQIEST